MKFEYFDIHSHIYFPDYDNDREEEINKIKKAGIGTIIIGTDFETSQKVIDLALNHENLFASIGQHPGDLSIDSVFDDRLKSLADNKKVVAIGECGLDYFRLPNNLSGESDPSLTDDYLKSIQKTIFEYHVDLALEVDKPLMLHIRSSKGSEDAYTDTLSILEHHSKISGNKLRGNVHFFAGSVDILRRFLAIGFSVSFTGVITFTSDYDELVRYAPLDMIMSETDAPFVAPVPYRGKRNSPLYIEEIVKKIAEIRGEPFDKVKIALINNTLKHFPGISS
jgi:TatD DNase family protein